MAKRLSDSGIWDKQWFRLLAPEIKCVWKYLTDRCNYAGIWEVDWEMIQIYIGGKPVKKNEILKVFGKKIVIIDNEKKWFMPGFIDFQYGLLKENNRVHCSVIQILKKEGLWKIYQEGIKEKK